MFILSKILPVFVYPLGLSMELIIAAAFFARKRKMKAAYALMGLSVLILLVFSNQFVAQALGRRFEQQYLPVDEKQVKAEAIIVLGGCCRPKIFPRSHVELCEGGDRIFEGIRLYKAGAAPVVIPTGGVYGSNIKNQSEGGNMRELMVEFGLPESAVIAETQARNTYENAVFVKKLLEEKHIGKNIILVTSASHMVRAVPIFKKAGFMVIPAPTDYLVDNVGFFWDNFLPKAENLSFSTQMIKEYIGIAVYRILGKI